MLHCNCKDVSQAECSALYIFDAHWFGVEHQSQCEALCFVILIDFLDGCYMLSPIHECNNSNKDKQMYSTRISMSHC